MAKSYRVEIGTTDSFTSATPDEVRASEADLLRDGHPSVRFVHLLAPRELIQNLGRRVGAAIVDHDDLLVLRRA